MRLVNNVTIVQECHQSLPIRMVLVRYSWMKVGNHVNSSFTSNQLGHRALGWIIVYISLVLPVLFEPFNHFRRLGRSVRSSNQTLFHQLRFASEAYSSHDAIY